MLPFAKLVSFLDILTPLFITISAGYAATRYGLIPREGIRYLGLYVIKIAMPCMLFKALSERPFQEIFKPDYIAIYALGSLFTLILAIFFSFYIRKKNFSISTVMAMGSSFSNSGYIGYPIVTQILGTAAIVPVALTLFVENAFMLPIALALASSTAGDSSILRSVSRSIIALAKNPIIWGIILGICISAFNLNTPDALLTVVDKFGSTSGSVALFTIGGSLVGLQLKGMRTDISQITFGKLFIHPSVILLFLMLTPNMPSLYQNAAVLLACMPMMSIYPIIGAQYGIAQLCATALLGATLLSFFSISWWGFSLAVL